MKFLNTDNWIEPNYTKTVGDKITMTGRVSDTAVKIKIEIVEVKELEFKHKFELWAAPITKDGKKDVIADYSLMPYDDQKKLKKLYLELLETIARKAEQKTLREKTEREEAKRLIFADLK